MIYESRLSTNTTQLSYPRRTSSYQLTGLKRARKLLLQHLASFVNFIVLNNLQKRKFSQLLLLRWTLKTIAHEHAELTKPFRLHSTYTLCPPNRADLNPVNYMVAQSCREKSINIESRTSMNCASISWQRGTTWTSVLFILGTLVISKLSRSKLWECRESRVHNGWRLCLQREQVI